MRFSLDSENYEDIHIEITDKEQKGELQDVIQEFCFGMASFFVDFASQLNCDTEKARGLKDVCISCINRNIEHILDNGILEDDDNSDDDLSEDDLDELLEGLRAADFSEEEIDSVIELVKSFGSIEAATDYLKTIGEDHGIDWNSIEEN